jgi:hypothetical protein
VTRVALVVGAALTAVVLVVIAFVTRPGTQVGQNVFVNPAGIINAFSTPTIVVNPRQNRDVVVTYRQDRPTLTAQLSWSGDGGATFHPTDLPLPAGLDRPFFPDAVFGADGTLYVAYVDLAGRGNVPDNLWVARSVDAGRTLSAPTMIATGRTFQPRITNGDRGAVDLTWLQASTPVQGGLTGDQVRVAMAQSTDGGRSWSPPTVVSAADGRLVSAASAVADRGSIVVSYERFGPTAGNLGTGGTTAAPDNYDIVVTRMDPGATSFSPPVVVARSIHTSQRFSLFFPEFPSLSAGPDGSLYLAWGQGLARGSDALVARSQDLGKAWSKPVRANDNPAGDGTARSLPTLSVAANGRVDVVLLDRRDDPTGRFAEVFLATSTDGAKTFHDRKLSSSAFDTTVGPSFGGNLPPDLGSHLSVASQATGVQVAWADSRLGNETTGRQDILSARVVLPPGGLGARKWLLAGAAALLVGAVGVLVAGRRTRGQNMSVWDQEPRKER